MKICDFTQAELDLFREGCNFTEVEAYCFEAKAKDKTDIQIGMELNISQSTVAVVMRRVRSKITSVLRNKVQHGKIETVSQGCERGCPNIMYHSMEEWARIPDFLSGRGVMYVYADYRTEITDCGEEVNIGRIKIGDGVNPVSKLPFYTMSITDKDMQYWDDKPDQNNNDFGKIVYIDSSFKGKSPFIFPTDGYLMLEFNDAEDYAQVNLFGADGVMFFKFEKRQGIDIHSKEVFVKKAMRCVYVSASFGAKIKFVPLI